MKLGLEIILIIVVFVSIKAYTQRDLVQNTPPAIKNKLTSGSVIELQNLYGKPLLLHFWASWCSICKMEQNSISNIHNDYTVLSVAMKSGSEQEVKNYMHEHNLSFPTIVDEDGAIAQQYGVRGVPVSFIINPQGKIAFIEQGFTTEYGLRFRLWLSSL